MTDFSTVLLVVAVAAAAVVVVWLLRRLRRAPLQPEAEENMTKSAPEPEEAAEDTERKIDFPGDGDEGAGAGPDTGAGLDASPGPEPVHFTVVHPPELVPERWAKLLAYVHLAGAREAVERDRERRLAGEPDEHRERSEAAVAPIRRESLIRVVPELPGCRFNPPQASVLWLEDWHVVELRLQADRGSPDFAPGRAVNGRVAFYVESVLVGEVPIWALLSDRAAPAETEPRHGEPVAAYRKVFASYSHRDGEVVTSLGRAYRALGMEFLRDVDVLRSGEEWNPRLLELIEEADLFQLYWSDHAAASPYVAQEWRHALEKGRERFVRPVFWRRPMPPPPDELGSIHFAFLPGFDGG